MTIPQHDNRSEQRKAEDERIAAEPLLPPLDFADGSTPKPLEELMRKVRRRPVAVVGVVENGVVRPLDPRISLPERSRVIIITTDLG